MESSQQAAAQRSDATDAVPTVPEPRAARAAAAWLAATARDPGHFERQWWKYAGPGERAIRELFDMSATRYYQVL